jgi:acyl-CoA reductase-like NAD-dependent aldehyde dehydrogenase
VARSRYDEVVEAVAEYTRNQVIGNPLDPSVTLGPMVSEQHLQRVLGYIDIARHSNARLVSPTTMPSRSPTTATTAWAVRSALNSYLEYKSIYASADQLNS